RPLGVPVNVTRGEVTAELRHCWGLNPILEPNTAEKNRADHRQHAIDAAVIALTTPKHLQNLARREDFRRGPDHGFPPPWPTFREELGGVIHRILVSHRVVRKIRGELHKDTAYGAIDDKKGEFVYRKRLDAVTSAETIDDIRDCGVRKLVQARLVSVGNDMKAFQKSLKEQPLCLPNRNGAPVPIHRVRLTERFRNFVAVLDETGTPYRYLKPESNHHVSVFEYTDEKGRLRREGCVMTMIDAARIAAENGKRRRENKKRGNKELPDLPIIRREHPTRPEAKFLYSLSINEMVLLTRPEHGEELCRVQTISSNEEKKTIDIRFRLHTAARLDDPATLRRIRSLDPQKATIRKVTIDPVGRLHLAHD
ncbi:MAG: hypothetical protein NTW86_08240, partial [Candidatus Sumerlaeota bacterium]|nr:hypothetical protein [Candidatus Sumerlaeota bacterium]